MKSYVSLTGALVAITMFATTVAMHQASSADRQGVTPVAAKKLVTKHGKKPLGFKGSGRTAITCCTTFSSGGGLSGCSTWPDDECPAGQFKAECDDDGCH